MQLKAIHFEWAIVTVRTHRRFSGGNHDKRSPEDAAIKPPGSLLVILGGFVVEGTTRFSQRGWPPKPRATIDYCFLLFLLTFHPVVQQLSGFHL